MTTDKCLVVHVRTVCIYSYTSEISRYIYTQYITKLLRLVLHPYYRRIKSGTFSKRSGADTNGFEFCEF